MRHNNSSMTDMDWANVKAYVAVQQRDAVSVLGAAVALVALLCIAMVQPDYWFLWFLLIWAGYFAVNRIFRAKLAAAVQVRDELHAYYSRQHE